MARRVIRGNFIVIPTILVVDDETDDPPLELRLETVVFPDDRSGAMARYEEQWPTIFDEQKKAFADRQNSQEMLEEVFNKDKTLPPRAVRRATKKASGKVTKKAPAKAQ
jgi:hypothetical protein